MRTRVTVHEGRLRGTAYRVIRSAEPLRRAALLDDDRWFDLYADEPSARTVGVLWLLAARSRRSLVHVPFRGVPPDAEGPRLDLVLAHHSLQFPAARWKELRGRLDRGRPHTAEIPDTDLPTGDPYDPARHHRENRDLLDEHVHAATLVLTGSAKVFRATAERFFDVADNGAAGAVTSSYGHYCAEIHPSDGVLGSARPVHVVYEDGWPE